MRLYKILVVDDDVDHFDVVDALLSKQNYQLYYSSNIKQMTAFLDVCQPDLILLDVMMPVVSGINVCQKIKSVDKWKNIPVIMVTALNNQKTLAQCLDAGADDFIGKPVNAIELRARVKSMLRIKQQFDDNQVLVRRQNQTIQLLEKTLMEIRGGVANLFSHEIRTPLSGILGPIELLKMELEGQLNGEINQILDWVFDSTKRLKKLISKLEMYTNLDTIEDEENFKIQIQSQPSSLLEVLQKISLTNNHSERLKVTESDIEIPLSLKYSYLVISELVDNAIKFSPPDTFVNVSTQNFDEKLAITVQDFGRGMKQEYIEQIAPMQQFERDKYEQQGLGLGLYFVKRIMEIIGGELQIKSVVEQGTSVTVIFPRTVSERI